MEREATLTSQEVLDLVHTILEGVDAAREGTEPRTTWANEMEDWCLHLLNRLDEDEA